MSTIGNKRVNRRIPAGLTISTLALMGALCVTAAPARAGFEWNPPPAAPKAAPAAASSTGPAITAAPLTPVVMDSARNTPPVMPPAPAAAPPAFIPVATVAPDANPSSATFPMIKAQAPHMPDTPAEADGAKTPAPIVAAGTVSAPPDAADEPIAPPPAPDNDTTAAPDETPAAANTGYKDIQGFGRDLPLALVMRQVVPADYAFSFAPTVDAGMPVSWQGDRPWNIVLQEALEPAKLVAVINDKTVRIQPLSAPRAAPPVLPPDTFVGATTADPYYDHAAPSAAAQSGMHYTDAQLAAIGAESGNYHPSYPRHTPIDQATGAMSNHRAVDAPLTAPYADNTNAADTDMDAAGNAGVTAAPPPVDAAAMPPPDDDAMGGHQPLSLTDKMAPPAPDANAPQDIGNVLNMHAEGDWHAAKGASLHDTLTAWASQAGVSLIWEAQRDFKLRHDIDTQGTFPDAVTKLLTAYNDKQPRPVGKLHPNLPNGPSVLIIENPAADADGNS